MSTKQRDILSTQENADDNPKQNSTLAEREPITGTPFTLIKSEEKWFMVMGDYRVTETTKTKEEQLDKLDTEKWLLIMHIAIIALRKMRQQEDREIEEYIAKNQKQEETPTELIPQKYPIK